MKKMMLFISAIALLSCGGDTKKLEQRIADLQLQNDQLKKEQVTMQVSFFEPFNKYQELVLSEPTTHPDTLISKYNLLIKDYPKSYWNHEARKRIKKINKNRKYWIKGKWELPEEDEDVIQIDPYEIISCPGC